MIKINPKVKFSYLAARGSAAERIQKSQHLTDKIYTKLKEHGTAPAPRFLPVQTLNDILFSVMPESNKCIQIKPICKEDARDCEALADFLYDRNKNIIGHSVQIPLSRKGIIVGDIPTFFHEITHVFDRMFNPKYIVREMNVNRALFKYNKSLKKESDKYVKLYIEIYGYDYEHFTNEIEKQNVLKTHKKKVLKFLKGKSVSDKINIIQDLRNLLKLEIHAHDVENDIIERMAPKGIDLSEYQVDTPRYLFKEKIKMLEDIAFDLIQKERTKLRKAHTNKEV